LQDVVPAIASTDASISIFFIAHLLFRAAGLQPACLRRTTHARTCTARSRARARGVRARAAHGIRFSHRDLDEPWIRAGPGVRPSGMSLRASYPLLAVVVLAACSKEPAEKAGPPAPAPPAPAPAPAEAAPATEGMVGKPAPDFTLPDLDGEEVALASFRGKVVVLEWFNPKCPFVEKSHTKGSLVGTAKRHTAAGVIWLAINSGAPGKQGHDPALNAEAVKAWGLTHPVLRDESGAVGKAYGATNTPNMFVIDRQGVVVYAGAIDNSPDGEGESPTGGTLVNHVDAALSDLAAGRPVATPTTKPYGCGVKYAERAEAAREEIYRMAATPDPGCRRGAWCTVRIELTALAGFHVNKEYPFKFVAAPAEGLEHDGTGAFRIESETSGVLVHRFRPSGAGPARVSGTFKLSVCTAERCEIESAPVSVEVPVG
jgi:cytochrome oxidase Cu insertion factor (SCO1/SenC/PrrC family)